jgi:SAM-dependent methyltransferase
MNVKNLLQRFKAYRYIYSTFYKCFHTSGEKFNCPVCNYTGGFVTVSPPTGARANAQCPRCCSLERHRLQYLVFDDLKKSVDFSTKSCLHIAPENFFREHFSRVFSKYHTADLCAKNVDFNFDLCDIPLEGSSYDFVYASHVLEHIADDTKALKEIKRILKPGGIAVLPVPIVSNQTIEYSEPNPNEEMHVRAPGPDYFKRYEIIFSRVDIFSSSCFEGKYQTWVFEDRSVYPTATSPHRQPVTGLKHQDFVAVCYV